jgi:predicted TPR repeat methyltransferase
MEGAAAVVREWHRAMPEDHVARHLLAAQGGAEAPERASEGFVRQTFDSYASSFDSVLANVRYAGPSLLDEALRSPEAGLDPSGLEVLDAGCGTGLCGPVLRPMAARLTGVDLSPNMLKRAALRELYDELVEGDLVRFLAEHPARFDLIVSADTLNYFGRLEPVMAAAAGALRERGRFAFTIELAADEPEAAERPFDLAHHGRYAHREAYVREAVTGAGLGLLRVERCVLRKEGGADVHALVVVAGS